MKRLAALYFVALSLFLLLATGCSEGGSGSGSGETGNSGSSSETTDANLKGDTTPTSETTQQGGATQEMTGSVQVEQVSSGSGGLSQRQVVIGPSAEAVSQATGVPVSDAGEGTYLAAFWGEQPTGGYTMEVLDARLEGNRLVVRLALKKPPPDAMVSQALTYPYAAAVIRGSIPENTDFTFVTQGGRELDWAVQRF